MDLSPNIVDECDLMKENITQKEEISDSQTEKLEEIKTSALENIATEVLLRIFSHFNVKERSAASRVCWRWNHILNSSKCVMDDVVVFNVFERSVWESSLSQNRGVRVTAFNVDNMDGLRSVLDLVSSSCSLKLWYKDVEFAKECIDVISSTEMKMKCMDLYPYSPDLAVEHLFDKLPNLKGLTMRPHGTQYFWDGLPLYQLPAFSQLTTLVLDSFNLMKTACLPSSLTTLEYLNRKGKNYLDLLPHLRTLKNLEYFSLSHADMSDRDSFTNFIDAVDISVLPRLNYMILRFCKLADVDISDCVSQSIPPSSRKMSLKMLKFDLCYGSLEKATQNFISMNSTLSILSINVMSDLAPVEEVMRISPVLERNKIWLHFGVLQRESSKELKESPYDSLEVPISLHKVMTKFEASFVDRPELLDKILLGPVISCQELKLIQCTALEQKHLESVAEKSILLRKLCCINCDRGRNTDIEAGMRHFVKHFEVRKSKNLEIVWKRSSEQSRPAGFFLDMVHSHQSLLKNKTAKFYSKTFSDDNDGETVIIWDKDQKKLVIQDYSDQDAYRVVGVIIPNQNDVEVAEEVENEQPVVNLDESVKQIQIAG